MNSNPQIRRYSAFAAPSNLRASSTRQTTCPIVPKRPKLNLGSEDSTPELSTLEVSGGHEFARRDDGARPAAPDAEMQPSQRIALLNPRYAYAEWETAGGVPGTHKIFCYRLLNQNCGWSVRGRGSWCIFLPHQGWTSIRVTTRGILGPASGVFPFGFFPEFGFHFQHFPRRTRRDWPGDRNRVRPARWNRAGRECDGHQCGHQDRPIDGDRQGRILRSTRSADWKLPRRGRARRLQPSGDPGGKAADQPVAAL